MQPLIRKLALAIRREWARHRHAPDAFPAIAADHLQKFALHKNLDCERILSWFSRQEKLPHQREADAFDNDAKYTFSVYQDEKMVVDFFYWTEAQMGIHDHEWGGAFVLLNGQDLTADYRFHAKKEYGPMLRLGELELAQAEHLRAGAVRPIRVGKDSIHRVWHLSSPTISINVRTRPDSRVTETYNYERGGIAHQYPKILHVRQICFKKAKLLKLLRQIRSPHFEKVARNVFKGASAIEAYAYCHVLWDMTGDPAFALEFLPKKRDPGFHSALKETFSGLEALFTPHWRMVTDPGENLILALLNTYSRSEEIYGTIASIYPRKNAKKLAEKWLRSLIASGKIFYTFSSSDARIFSSLLGGRTPASLLPSAQVRSLRRIELFKPLWR